MEKLESCFELRHYPLYNYLALFKLKADASELSSGRGSDGYESCMYELIICFVLKMEIGLCLVTGPACPMGHIGGRPRPVRWSINVRLL